MRPIVILITTCLAAGSVAAQKAPRDAVDALFDAMRAGNGEAVRDLVVDGAPLMRVEPNGSVRNSSFDDWANWVDVQNEGDADEQIFAVTVRNHGNLASVWAPFILHYKGELAGCGVNQFTLTRTDNKWAIVHGIDTADGGDCTTFKARYHDK